MELSRTWQIQEAKSRLSELVKMAARAPQPITLRGEPVAVVISYKRYQKLIKPGKGLAELLHSAPESLDNLELPIRRDTRIRKIEL